MNELFEKNWLSAILLRDNSPCSTVFEILAFLCLQFLRKIRKFKMAAIFGESIFFENWHGYSAEIPCGSKISSKTLHLARFSRYKHFYVLQFLQKIQNGHHFWRDKNFLQIGIATLQRYPEDQKCRRNCSI